MARAKSKNRSNGHLKVNGNSRTPSRSPSRSPNRRAVTDDNMSIDPAQRKSILRVLFASLLLDLVSCHAWRQIELTLPDLLHIHSTSISITSFILSIAGRPTKFTSQSSLSLSECLQEIFRHSNKFKIRYCTAGRSSGIIILSTTGDSKSFDRSCIR